jgi:hypothetical protein
MEWKIINGYPDYAISTNGDVKSLRFNRILKKSINSSGYYYINLLNNRQRKTTAVHRLVIEHFGQTPPDQNLVVDHINGNKLDNQIDNLEWVTIKENTLRSYHNMDKKEKVRQLRKEGWTMQRIAESIGMSVGFVQDSIYS